MRRRGKRGERKCRVRVGMGRGVGDRKGKLRRRGNFLMHSAVFY